jgi:hypothetical protein
VEDGPNNTPNPALDTRRGNIRLWHRMGRFPRPLTSIDRTRGRVQYGRLRSTRNRRGFGRDGPRSSLAHRLPYISQQNCHRRIGERVIAGRMR